MIVCPIAICQKILTIFSSSSVVAAAAAALTLQDNISNGGTTGKSLLLDMATPGVVRNLVDEPNLLLYIGDIGSNSATSGGDPHFRRWKQKKRDTL